MRSAIRMIGVGGENAAARPSNLQAQLKLSATRTSRGSNLPGGGAFIDRLYRKKHGSTPQCCPYLAVGIHPSFPPREGSVT